MHDDSNTDRGASSGGSRSDSGQEGVSVDELHRILERERRRSVLSYLAGCPDDRVPVDELVGAVAERERPEPGPATHRDRIEVDLYHVHLPTLADSGVIDYDPVDEVVRYTASPKLESLLEASTALQGDERGG